jgi:hypothetical protein
MHDLHEIQRLVRAGTPIIAVDTVDIARSEEIFAALARNADRPTWRYSLASGLARAGMPASTLGPGRAPHEVLAHILSIKIPGVWWLLDVAPQIGDPMIKSQLREIALRHREVPHTLILVGPGAQVPPGLRTVAARMELALPGHAELIDLIAEESSAWSRESGRPMRRDEDAVTALQRQLAGLTHGDARRLVRVAIRDDGVLDARDLPEVIAAKHRLLDSDGALSLELDVAGLDQVAGLDRLKRWLAERGPSFTAARVLPGLDPPKGILLLGVQGAGKSLAARAVAGAWRVPLLRLDFATLYDKYIGETERKLREALRTATVMAPCVLWVDEIEKGLASGGEESGPGKRVLGTLLTWMAERRERVFMVATANDIQALPPELMRKGRFDEIFFVDLPGPAAREAIVRIHARKRGLDPATLDATAIAIAAAGFSGAEIEQALVAALYAAHARGEPLATRHIVEAIESTRPLSVIMAERIDGLRAWAAERTVAAG